MRTAILLIALLGAVVFVGTSSGCVRRNDPTLFQRVEYFVENDQVALYNKTHAGATAEATTEPDSK